MELSGNLTQYESGSAAGWSTVVVFQTFPTHFLDKDRLSRVQFHGGPCGSVGLPPKQFLTDLGGFHFFPMADGSCGRVE